MDGWGCNLDGRKILTIVAEITTVLSGACGIATFVMSFRDVQVGLAPTMMVLLAVSLAAGVASYALGRGERHREDEESVSDALQCEAVSNAYYQAGTIYAESYFETKGRMEHGRYVDNRSLFMDTVGSIRLLLDQYANLLEEWSGCKISTCVKIIDGPRLDDGSINFLTGTVSTLARSRGSDPSRERRDSQPQKIVENTDFKQILESSVDGSYPDSFYCADLVSYQRELRAQGRDYLNSTPNWQRHYKSTMVVPIRFDRSRLFYEDNWQQARGEYETLGFLCADSLSTGAFRSEREGAYVKLATTFAMQLYLILSRYNYYAEQIGERK